jgi:Ni/Co efflux regulator RcnB
MKRWKTNCALALIVAGMLAIGQAAADKPSWAGGGDKGGKGGKGKQSEQSDHQKGGQRDESRGRTGEYFGDRHRTIVHDYYSEQYRRGHCPPGLARKNNGCQPPGQAKKWTVGRPLPRDVIFYNLEPRLIAQFGPSPSGHRYVRVASDILLITIGTGMVIDAIQDLGRM